MLDADLAIRYGVSVARLNEAVKRNRDRFPDDFMFQLSPAEFHNLRAQLGHPPYAFTEQGVAMLSVVFGSKRAVRVNIEIMRAFVRLRELLSTHRELAQKLAELEHKIGTHDEQIQMVFEAIRQLMAPPEPNKRKIGFLVKERAARYGRANERGKNVFVFRARSLGGNRHEKRRGFGCIQASASVSAQNVLDN